MISEIMTKRYCKDDISLIENYEQAVNDKTKTWHCHHRGEILACGRYTPDDLKKFGLYWKRPASELIFISKSKHKAIHNKDKWNIGKKLSCEAKLKIANAHKGSKASEETKIKIGKAHLKPIIQYSKTGEFIKEWSGTIEASRTLKIHASNITCCCQGKGYKSAGGFVWRYK